MIPDPALGLQFVLKVTARCNLNCSYCYVFNKADQSWRQRSRVMPNDVFLAALDRIRRHCDASGQDEIPLLFHGGEPLLAGPARFRRWLAWIDRELGHVAPVKVVVQTNATLIGGEWARLFAEHEIAVGVSLDGPPELNDRFRVDHVGRGSYDKVLRGIDALQRAGLPLHILCVIPLGADGLSVYRHFQQLGAATANFLLPDQTHDDIGAVRRQYGPTPAADFLVPVADEWIRTGGDPTDVPLLRSVCRLVLGGDSHTDMFGNAALSYVFVEADGEIEGLDVLRVDGEGVAATGLNVRSADFLDIASVSDLHHSSIFVGMPLPTDCLACPERRTCAGGYLPHRFSRARGFDNRSAWCQDILVLFDYLRRRLGVDWTETDLRRDLLADVARNGL